LQTSVEKVLWAADIPVFQGYGLTETSPLITLNHYPLEKSRIGTVGPVINGVQVKIAGDGEILCKGPNVMLGYFKNPELTKEVIDENGWFHTGDIGKFHNGIFLKISGRKKELFKTSYGKYVAPLVIENRLKESEFIEQLMVIGEGEKFAGAIISPNFNMLSKWLETIHKIKIPDRKKLIKLPPVNARFEEEIYKCNQSLGMPEQIKQFILVSEKWSVSTSELSPTLKLRRHFILKKYKKLITNIYNPAKKTRD
jgi:long-chain acyl-CoA synthetase